MSKPLAPAVSALPDQRTAAAISPALQTVYDRLSSQMYSNSTLVIKAGGGVLAKTGGAISYGVANGVPIAIAASTDMPSLVGLNITAAKFNVICFFVDQSGTLSVLMGTEGAAIGNVKFPEFPKGKALVGFLSVTHSSTFTGGTTALDTATTLYFSPVGAFDPTATLS